MSADVLTAAEMGRRSGEVRRRREAAIARIVTETRRQQGLPPTVQNVDVLERLADHLAGGASDAVA